MYVPAVAVELGPLLRDTTVKFYPAVFLANAMAAFILNLVHLAAQAYGCFAQPDPHQGKR